MSAQDTPSAIAPTLQPCPFCGGAAARDYSGMATWVQCVNCTARTARYSEEEAAAGAWNNRFTPSQSERIYTKADMEAACKIAVAAHKNYGKSAADFAETQLKRACHLLREANPERRAWAEDRDQFLEIVGEFKEPKE